MTAPDQLVAIWRKIIVGDEKSWVLFRQGTCVVLAEPGNDPAEEARTLLAEWGPTGNDNPVADYLAVKLTKDPGWVVACRHPDILTYIGPDEVVDLANPSEERIGLLGRGRRYADSAELHVIHQEIKSPENGD